MLPSHLVPYFQRLHTPQPNSHKGQNGKTLIIGGSELFHAASKWSLDIASRLVDMVFYTSVPSNNELVKQAKGEFWNGIVIERLDLESYLEEADSILIGPGMTREKKSTTTITTDNFQAVGNSIDWDHDTYGVTNYLLAKYPHKNWVIDAGALQMVEPALLHERCIVTPHYKELMTLFEKLPENSEAFGDFTPNMEGMNAQLIALNVKAAQEMSRQLNGATLVIKGAIDIVANSTQGESVAGGHAGMTKGGTGDVLAGLITGLYATNEVFVSAVVGSYVNKKAGEKCAEKVGSFFNASDLVSAIPEVLWTTLQSR